MVQNLKGIFLIALINLFAGVVAAQIGYGFRAGLSSSTFLGPEETDAQGNSLENYKFASGFHIGLSVNYRVTDLFGFRGEFIFSQRGTEYEYEGDSWYIFNRNTTDEVIIFGRRTQNINVSSANLEFPINAYYRLGPLEISGGVNVSLQVASTGGGNVRFEGTSPLGNTLDPFEVTLTHNYIKDRAGAAGPPIQTLIVDGKEIEYPGVTGAYYDFEAKDQNLYKLFDFGLMGGLSFYLNEGLYLGGRVIYGLVDVDENAYDIALNALNSDGSYIQRADKNTNLTIQASIGFIF